ncbi:MAG: hypothetical protein ACI9JN_000757 [Bacteroidia bacterium]|jgi:hypothetical protein
MKANRFRNLVLGLVILFNVNHNCLAQTSFERAGDYYALKHHGQLISPYIYTEVSEYHEGLAWVNKGELYGYIDTLGNAITDFVYADVSAFKNGFACVSRDTQDGYYGYVNRIGKEICPLSYIRTNAFEKGVASVQVDSIWTLIDTTGNQLFTAQYDYPPIVVSQNFIIVSRQLKWGVIDSSNNMVYPFIYDLITADGAAYTRRAKVYLGLL